MTDEQATESKKLERKLKLFKIRRLAPGILVIIVLAATVLWLTVGLQIYALYDIAGRAQQVHHGTVLETVIGTSKTGVIYWHIHVQLDKQKVWITKGNPPLRSGQKVVVNYTVGRSGVYYFGNVTPETGAAR